MNKKQFISFCATQGWSASYSAKAGGFFINPWNTGATLDDVEVAVVQHLGVLPDWKLFID